MGEFIRFQSLEFTSTPWTRWVWSFVIHASGVLALIAIPVSVQRAIQPPDRIASISLEIPPKPAPVRPILRAVKTPVEVPLLVVKPVLHTEFHAPPVKSPEVKTVALPPLSVEIPKPLEVARIEAPKIDLPPLPITKPVIKEEVFTAHEAPAPTRPAPRRSIKTGGFGDPNGLAPSPASSKGLIVQTLGAFDSPAGQLTKAAGGKRKAVASAGFGAETAAAGAGNGHAAVHGAGFGDYNANAPATRIARTSAPVETQVEITFKPKPLYTPEAREKKIEGEVELEVLFASTGQIRVLRVIRSLGFGLDENARAAAGQIRFRPGTRNGNPVDVTGNVHIVFELT